VEADKTTGIRTFELDVPVSGALDVPFEDWPANIQDGIWAALEKLAEHEQLPLKIVHAKYMKDVDLPEEAPGHHYLHIIASEVVMADERTLTPGRVIRELPEDIRGLLN